MAMVGLRLVLFLWSVLKMVCSARVVLEFGRKAYWVGERILLVRRWVMICLLISVSSGLARMGMREIGL